MPNQQPGCCKFCGEPVYEILDRYQDGPKKGEVLSVGLPTAEARKISLLLNTGEVCDITACANCSSSLTREAIIEIWKAAQELYWRDLQDEHRQWIGLSKLSVAQQKEYFQFILDRFPIGVLCIRSIENG